MTTASPNLGSEFASKREARAYYALNRLVYPALALFYDVITLPLRRVRPEVTRFAGVDPGKRVLDVATGTGAQALAFAERGADVTGIDISDAMLRTARRKNRFANARFEHRDATNLDFADGLFDVSSVSFALHEMPESIRVRVVHEMARVTMPGGTLVVVDYGLPRSRFWSEVAFRLVSLYERDHYPEFVRSDWHRLLRGAGVEVEEDRSLLGGNVRVLIARVLRAQADLAPAPEPQSAST